MAVGEHGFHDPVNSLIFFFGAGLSGVSFGEKLFKSWHLPLRDTRGRATRWRYNASGLLLLFSFWYRHVIYDARSVLVRQ
jgi:hypothetical protein